jgi:hypothetical protein
LGTSRSTRRSVTRLWRLIASKVSGKTSRRCWPPIILFIGPNPMSALHPKRTCALQLRMSALGQ